MEKSKGKKIIIVMICMMIVVICGLFFYYRSIIKKPLKLHEEKAVIEVKAGEGFNNLLERLDDEGILRNKILIKVNLKLSNKEATLIPGMYEVDKDISLEKLIATLQTEDLTTNQISITIPEGYNIDEMADLFQEKGVFSKEEFINAVKAYKLPAYIKVDEKKKYNLEGFLYPDTYNFNNDAKPEQVIEVMNVNFYNMIQEASKNVGKEIKDDDIERIVTIASLIEEEARLEEERSTVSSVIYNRLKKDMKLEFCSTINYAWGEHIENLRNRHLQIESPYNTYKNSGLPVGPIDNPGIKSIEAAIKPAETDYLYFMLLYNQGGKHHYSTNGVEHEKVKLEEEAKQKENK